MFSQQWDQSLVSSGPARFHIHFDTAGRPYVINKTADQKVHFIYRFQEPGLYVGTSHSHPRVETFVAPDGRLYEANNGGRGRVLRYSGIVVDPRDHSVVKAFEITGQWSAQPRSGPIQPTYLPPDAGNTGATGNAHGTSAKHPPSKWDGVFYDDRGTKHTGGHLLSQGLEGVAPSAWPNGTQILSKLKHVFVKSGTRGDGRGVWHDTTPSQSRPSSPPPATGGAWDRVQAWWGGRRPQNGDTRSDGREVFRDGQWYPNDDYTGAYGATQAQPNAGVTPGSLSADGSQMFDGQNWGPTPINTITPYGYWNGTSSQPYPVQQSAPGYGYGYGAPAAPTYPVYGAPAAPQPPAYGAPSYGAPSYGAPSYGAPSYGAPSYGAPYDPTNAFVVGAEVALAGVQMGQGGGGQAGGDVTYIENGDGTITTSDGRVIDANGNVIGYVDPSAAFAGSAQGSDVASLYGSNIAAPVG